MNNLEAEAISFIKEHEPPEGYYVGFSGGKDSVVLDHLVKMSGVKHSKYFSNTGLEAPDTIRFIREHHKDVITIKYPVSVFKLIAEKISPPTRARRWCCDKLKEYPSRTIPLRTRLMGIRAEESVKRASRPRIDYMESVRSQILKPIFHWTEENIWEYIEKYSIPYLKAYDEGEGRQGCIICPFMLGRTDAKFLKRKVSMEKFPGVWKAYKHSCERFFNRIDCDTHTSFNDYWADYLLGFEPPRTKDIVDGVDILTGKKAVWGDK